MQPVISDVLRLMSALQGASIPCCVWKNVHKLGEALGGASDIDLLVQWDQRAAFEHLARELGYIAADDWLSPSPCIRHYYGLDEKSGAVTHLHVYYRLVTGESHTKNYWFSVEKEVLAHASVNAMGVPEASAADQAALYLLRQIVKLSCLPGILLYWRERADYAAEWKAICTKLGSATRAAPLLSRTGDLQLHLADLPLSARIRASLQHKSRLRPWRRYGGATDFAMRYRQIFLRLANKLIFKRRKTLGGCVLAVAGSDGSGKSTAVTMLQRWLGRDFTIRVFHFGRPSPTLMTIPVRLLLAVWRAGAARGSATGGGAGRSVPTGSLAFAVRHLALAYERYRTALRAKQCALRGEIAILDRYRSLAHGGMDGPRIPGGEGCRWWRLAALERRMYESIAEADVLLRLNCDLQTAIERNRSRSKANKETDAEIRRRFNEASTIDYAAQATVRIDANQPLAVVERRMKAAVWQALWCMN